MNHDPLRVAVVSRNDVIRSGLTLLLDTSADRICVVHSASHDGYLGDADVIVYDLTGTDGDFDDELAHLLATSAPVVAVQPYERSDLGEQARLRGVAELVAVDVASSELVAAVERAAAGTSADLEGRRSSYRTEVEEEFGLTEREMDMLELVASGRSNEDIASLLFLSINSVKSYIRSAYGKIGVLTRSQAMLWAIEHGLAHPERAGEPTRDSALPSA